MGRRRSGDGPRMADGAPIVAGQGPRRLPGPPAPTTRPRCRAAVPQASRGKAVRPPWRSGPSRLPRVVQMKSEDGASDIEARTIVLARRRAGAGVSGRWRRSGRTSADAAYSQLIIAAGRTQDPDGDDERPTSYDEPIAYRDDDALRDREGIRRKIRVKRTPDRTRKED